MKKIIIVFAICLKLAAQGGDTLIYSARVDSFADGDTFFTAIHWHPMKDSIQSIINGRLGNVNLADDAEIKQSKIDSTYNDATDWIYNYTKRVWSWINGVLQLRQSKGISVFINDTTTYSQNFNIISDSTDTIVKFGEDSIVLYKNTRIENCLRLDTIRAINDSIYLNANSGNNMVLLVSDPTGQNSDTLRIDATIVNISGVMQSGQVSTATINTGWGDVECRAMDQDVRTTDSVSFETVKFDSLIYSGDKNGGLSGIRWYDTLGVTDSGTTQSILFPHISSNQVISVNVLLQDEGNDYGWFSPTDASGDVLSYYVVVSNDYVDTLEVELQGRGSDMNGIDSFKVFVVYR